MKLHATVFGEGAPFLILHGFLGMGDNWKTFGKKMSKHGYQVHLIDQRNHGRSPHSDIFTYEVLASDLLAYCIENAISDFTLLGHSMGGKTAMLFATMHPKLIKKLIIVDIGPKYYPLHHQDILDGLNALDFEELHSRGEVDKALSAYIQDTGVRLFLMKNLFWKEKKQLGLRINLDVLIKNSSEIGVELPKNLIFRGETLFLKGSNSNYIVDEDKDRIKNQFPNSILREISDAGHWVHAENPIEFSKEVFEFVKL